MEGLMLFTVDVLVEGLVEGVKLEPTFNEEVEAVPMEVLEIALEEVLTPPV